MDRIEIGDIVTSTGRNATRYEVKGVYPEGNQLWLKPTTGERWALSYDADDFVKVEPFFEAGKTYTRKAEYKNHTNVFACTASETDTDGGRVAFGRYYRDERVDSYRWLTLVSFMSWKGLP